MSGWQGDWSSAEALKGRRPIDLINQITAAYNERASAYWSLYMVPSFSPGEVLRVSRLWWQVPPARLMSSIIELGVRYYKHDYTLPISDFFDGSFPADRYTVANIEAALGEQLIPAPPRYALSREWMVQMYKVLNLYRVTYRTRTGEPEKIWGNISDTTFVSYYNPLQKTKSGGNDWSDWFDAYSIGGGQTTNRARIGAYLEEDSGGDGRGRYCKTDVYYRQVTSTPEFPVGKKYHGKLLSFHGPLQLSPAGSAVDLDRYGNAPDPQGRTDFAQLALWYDLGIKTAEESPEPEYVGTYNAGEPTEGGFEDKVGFNIATVMGFFDWAVEGGFEYGDWIV